MAELNLEIVTPSKSAFSGTIKSVTVPGTKGRFQVLVNHAPIISTLEIGLIEVDFLDGKPIHYATAGGTIEVLDNNVLILVDSIEPVSEIDEERALLAKQRAEERLAAKESDLIYIRAKAALERAKNRISSKEKYQN